MDLGVSRSRLRQQVVDVACVVGYGVGYERERRREPHPRLPPDLAAQNTLGAFQRGGAVRAGGFVAKDCVEDGGITKVVRDPSVGDRDKPQPRVLHSLLNRLGHDDTNAIRELARSRVQAAHSSSLE